MDGRRRLHHEDRSRGGRRPVLPRHEQHDLRGLVQLGRWTHWYFGPYIVIWGFVYGAAAMAGTGLPLHSLLPVLQSWAWGILSGLIGLALVWWGRYSLFEKVCAALVGIMFVTMVGAALLNPAQHPRAGRSRPAHPGHRPGQRALARRGVGGTITLAAYGYWIREKGWTTPGHMRVMRLDNTVAYVVTGIFVIATIIVGAELLYSANIAVKTGDKGLLDLSTVLADRYGDWSRQGVPRRLLGSRHVAARGRGQGRRLDDVRRLRRARPRPGRRPPGRQARRQVLQGYILWLTFPPMIMMFLGKPVYLILAYGVLGAFFMPFLSVTLLWLLNRKDVPSEWRNKVSSNVVMVLIAAAFIGPRRQRAREAVRGA